MSRSCSRPRPDSDSHLSGNVNTHAVECKDEAKVIGEDESQSGGIQLDLGGGQSPWGEKPEDGQPPLRERSDRGEDDGKVKEDGAVTEGSEAGQNELSIAVLFDELNIY